MPARVEITKDVASQKIWFHPQEGRPSATPSVVILDQYGSTITAAATTYVTQSTVNTTLGAAAAAGAKTITVAAATGIEFGGTYLLTNASGQREWIRAMGVSSLVVTLDEPLEYAHPITTTTLVGTGFYRTLQAAEVDELVELYRARATYTVSSQQYVMEVPFDVVLVPLQNPLTVEFVKQRHPGIMAMEGSTTRGTDFLDARTVAWDRVLKGIRGAGVEPYQWRPALLKTPDDVEEWALAELDLQLHHDGVPVLPGDWQPETAMKELQDRVRVTRELALSSLEWMDANDDDSREDDEIRPSRGPDFVR